MNKICRICLEEGAVSSIFANNFNLCLNEMVEYCCSVKISQDDGLPDLMCSNCMYKLGIAYHFKQTCLSSESRLRQYLGIQVPNKTTETGVMTDPIQPIRQTIIKKCKCKSSQKKKSYYKRKPESEQGKRGPKPKPKQKIECYQCNKEFNCKAQLENHVRTHTGDKPFECMFCPSRFTQKHNLTIHLRVHTGEKPFQCEHCSKSFAAQGNLNAHIKIHTGQRDHVCTICNKSFITSSELTRHMTTHRPVRKFRCDICAATYIHARDLNLHKMKKHQVSLPCKNQENYNGNIDIISLDNSKKSTVPMKDVHSHLIPHLLGEKQMPSTLSSSTEETKFTHYTHLPKPMQTCVICGEIYVYSELSQHYAVRHKGFNPNSSIEAKTFTI